MKDLITVAVKPIRGLNINSYYGNCVYNQYCPLLNKTISSTTQNETFSSIYPFITIFFIAILVIGIVFYVKKSLGGQSWKINA